MFTITNKFRSVIALGAVAMALAATTLATAAPALAAVKTPVSGTQTISFGNKFGTGCTVPWGTVPNGSTSKTTVAYSDGSSETNTATCTNGKWISDPRVLPVGAVNNVAAPTTVATAP